MRAYRLLLWKAYFDRGYAVTNYFRALLFVYGAASLNVKLTILFSLGWGLSCFFIGWGWYRWGFTETENEIQNRFNPFQREVRRRLKQRLKPLSKV